MQNSFIWAHYFGNIHISLIITQNVYYQCIKINNSKIN